VLVLAAQPHHATRSKPIYTLVVREKGRYSSHLFTGHGPSVAIHGRSNAYPEHEGLELAVKIVLVLAGYTRHLAQPLAVLPVTSNARGY
jgi:hypothetical protein